MRAFWRFSFKVALWVGGIGLVVAGVLRLFFVDVVVMGHNGMAPTILSGEEVLMWRGAAEAEMGDIVICHHPTDAGRMVTGRVIAKGGMSVTVERGNLSVSGTSPSYDVGETVTFFDLDTNRNHQMQIELETLGNTDHQVFDEVGFTFRLRETTVRPNSVYLMGDNRASRKHDSRSLGDVSLSRCLGTVFMRLKPVDDRGADLGHSWLDMLK